MLNAFKHIQRKHNILHQIQKSQLSKRKCIQKQTKEKSNTKQTKENVYKTDKLCAFARNK